MISTPVLIGIVALAVVGGGIALAWPKISAWWGGASANLDAAAQTIFTGLKQLEGKAELTPVGRSVLTDVAIFLEQPIMAFPDSPERKAAIDGRKALTVLFGSAPPQPVQTIPPTTVS